MTLYERLAAHLGDAIRRGTLRPGERMPSVRNLASERGVSIATAVTAYQQLENIGLIEARPKSGHYVCRRHLPRLAEPHAPRALRTAARPSVSTGVADLLAAIGDPSIVPLGAAYVNAEHLPIVALNRIMAGIAREMATAGATYDAPPGLPTLRQQLARRAVTWGMALHEDDFITTMGATEALSLGLRAVARAGDAIAVESPVYFGILQAIEGLGMQAIEVPAHPRTGIDLDALEEVVRGGRVRAVMASTTLSNPLGASMPDAAKERLLRILARQDLPLVEDDVYGDLVFDGTRPRPARAFDREGRVLLCGSVSKTLAPGYRVGWIVPGRYHENVLRLKYAQMLVCPTLTQMAVAEFLGSGGYDKHLRRLRRVLAANIERFRAAIAAHFPAGTRVTDPLGGFVLWIELPPRVDAPDLQRRALERGVSLAPGPVFSARGRFGNFIRLSCGIWSTNVEAAVARLGRLVTAELEQPSRDRRH
jgi:DNA-binding transcriptional MocR family regulator